MGRGRGRGFEGSIVKENRENKSSKEKIKNR